MSKRLLKSKLAFSVGAYTFVNLINKGIPVLMLPLLTHYLTTEDYGILTNIESLITITVILVGLNASSSFTRQYVKKDVNIKDYFVSSARIMILCFLGITLVYSTLARQISEWTDIPQSIVYVVSVFGLLNNFTEIFLAKLRIEDKPFHYGLYQILKTIVEVGISVLLVVAYDYDWFGRFFGLYVSGIIAGLAGLLIFYRSGFFKGTYRKDYKNHFFRYGVPLVPHTISGVVIYYSDKLIVTQMLGIDQNGLYSVAFLIGMGISLIQNSFNQAWVPWLYKSLETGSESTKRKIVKVTYLYMIGMIALAAVLWLCTPLIYYFLGADFQEGMPIVGIIGLGFAFNGMYKMMINYVFYAEKTRIISTLTVLLALLNIGLNIWFINIFGLIGSAYASLLTFFVQFVLAWWIGNKVYPMPWFKFNR